MLIAEHRFQNAADVFAQLPPAMANEAWCILAGMKLAQHQQDHERMLGFATALRTLTPAAPEGYVGSCLALRLLRRVGEAEPLAAHALQAFPRDEAVLLEACRVAEANKEIDLALQRWSLVRQALPESPIGFTGAVKFSMRQRLAESADGLLAEGMARFPDDRLLLTQAAWHAIGNQRWDDAERHWQRVMQLHPDDPALALEAATSFIGRQAGRRRRMPGVLQRLAEINRCFPSFAPGYSAHLDALCDARRLTAAAKLAKAAAKQFPEDHEVAVSCARVAEGQNQPGEALAMLEAARQRCGMHGRWKSPMSAP